MKPHEWFAVGAATAFAFAGIADFAFAQPGALGHGILAVLLVAVAGVNRAGARGEGQQARRRLIPCEACGLVMKPLPEWTRAPGAPPSPTICPHCTSSLAP